MQIEKMTIIRIKTTDGKEVKPGNTVIFATGGRNIIGVFKGIGKKGSWEFSGVAHFEHVYFTVAPKAIQEMYLADVNVHCGEAEGISNGTKTSKNEEEIGGN